MNTEIISEVEYLNEKITEIAKLNTGSIWSRYPVRAPTPPAISET
jgi:hypothetical protein